MKIDLFLNKIINLSVEKQYSDIYILPNGSNYLIKLHSNFETINYCKIDSGFASKLINFCKYKSGMAISEHRRPQLGSMTYKIFQKHFYLRLSSVSNFKNKESLVIRIMFDLKNLKNQFLFSDQFKKLNSLVLKRGLILFAGPTGSGKTTSIYKLAHQFGKHKMVMTIEDPVEIKDDTFLQLQVNNNAQMSYIDLLKVGLRHRPDVFIIGEIRDEETAKIAIEASLSGHLVLSTIHAKTPYGVINRLIQLNVSEYYLKQCLNTVVYQRIISTVEGNGALLNIDEGIHLFKHKNNNFFYQNWREKLNGLFKNKKITSKQMENYWYG